MNVIQVVTWDFGTGVTVVDHTWRKAHHNGKRKTRNLFRRVNRWARKAAQADHSTDHAVYVREV